MPRFAIAFALVAVVSAQTNGTCTDAADQAAWTGGGKAKFTTDLSTCGKKCLGAKACVSSCLQSAEKYSAPCADCFGDLTACTESNCLFPCLKSPPTKACADCQNSKCVPAFVSCSGIPQSDLPPPPPAPLMVAANATGACSDDADQAIWTAKGSANFQADMTKCGTSCMGTHDCVAKCITTAEGYSTACASCFGDLGTCSSKNCLLPCIGGASAKCNACQLAHCVTPFTTCAGVTPPTN